MAMEDDDQRHGTASEQTPLLSHHEPATRSRSPLHLLPNQRKRAAFVYLFTFGFIALLALAVHGVRVALPEALSDRSAQAKNGFAGMHAFETYLSRFTEPHPVNSRENIAMKAWLDSLAFDFQKEGQKTGVQVDVVTKDGIVVANENVWFAKSKLIIGEQL